ncbi:uncharacterized protein LOC131010278 [Salvia miltiorrhiza]|uniref:uncharacterized protein LOC131010278 n=1 Tax=Salvia miltiorrhiza TaxID=226208 RepID=UPI0025AD93A9|nr:uncharacterized protein LOC131010278 [Salvia miltiorrhiza]
MHSSSNFSSNPSSIREKLHINSNKSIKSFARAQIPPSTLIEFKLAVSRGNYHKNVDSCKRNRLRVRNSANQEEEAQFSQEKGAPDNGGGGPSTSLLSFLCPLLKLFSAGDPSAERNYLLEEATSSLSTLARLLWGSRSLPLVLNNEKRANPSLPLQLYEFEACPFCRRVREAITELDLSVEIFPCPKGSVRHRAMVKRLGGREQFPFLVDLNTGTSIYESSDIVKYLFQQYGGNRSPSFGILESTLLTGWVPTLLRAGRGMTLWENSVKESPPRKLELFSYENNPYARIVREALCELELPYILQSVGEGSIRKRMLNEISGSKEVPYLVDHNTGVEIGDYKKIVSYLFETYNSKRVPAYPQQ